MALQHSPIGASSSERWFNCPGSLILAQGMPNIPSKYAAEGTVAHMVGDFHITARTPVDDHWLGSIVEQEGFEIEVTEEMLSAVETYVDFVYAEMAKFHIPWENLASEKKFNLKHIDPEAYGTSDLMLHLVMDRLIVVDYKHGAGVPVEVLYNTQLLYYLLGAYYELPEADRKDLTRFESVVCQPRAPHIDGPIRRAVYTLDQLMEFEAELTAAIRRVREKDPTLKAGPHCKFCPAKATCPEIRNEVGRQMQHDFAEVDVSLPNPMTMTPEEVAHVLRHAGMIKDWIEGVMAHGHHLAENGTDIPGFKLADKRANRKWIDEDAVFGYMRNKGYDIADITTTKLKSPAQMEALVKKVKIKADLEDLWEKPTPGKTLVPVSDSRETRQPRLLTDFQHVVADDI